MYLRHVLLTRRVQDNVSGVIVGPDLDFHKVVNVFFKQLGGGIKLYDSFHVGDRVPMFQSQLQFNQGVGAPFYGVQAV